MSELKPCPFCGFNMESKQPFWNHPYGADVRWNVECGHCNAMVYADSKDEVVKAWNRRGSK